MPVITHQVNGRAGTGTRASQATSPAGDRASLSRLGPHLGTKNTSSPDFITIAGQGSSRPQFSPSGQWEEGSFSLRDAHANKARSVGVSSINPGLSLPCFSYAELVSGCPHLTLSRSRPRCSEAADAEGIEGEMHRAPARSARSPDPQAPSRPLQGLQISRVSQTAGWQALGSRVCPER